MSIGRIKNSLALSPARGFQMSPKSLMGLKKSDGCPDLPILDDVFCVIGRDLVFGKKVKNLFCGFFVAGTDFHQSTGGRVHHHRECRRTGICSDQPTKGLNAADDVLRLFDVERTFCAVGLRICSMGYGGGVQSFQIFHDAFLSKAVMRCLSIIAQIFCKYGRKKSKEALKISIHREKDEKYVQRHKKYTDVLEMRECKRGIRCIFVYDDGNLCAF